MNFPTTTRGAVAALKLRDQFRTAYDAHLERALHAALAFNPPGDELREQIAVALTGSPTGGKPRSRSRSTRPR